MSFIQLSDISYQAGTTESRDFAESNSDTHNDWQNWGNVPFDHVINSDPIGIRVLITPNNRSKPDVPHVAAPVGIVHDVTQNGFQITARNSDTVGGTASFDWIAFPVAEIPSKTIPFARMRVAQTRDYTPNGVPGDTMDQPFNFWTWMPADVTADNEFIFLTATDSGVRGNNTAAVGVVENPSVEGFTLHSRNSDSAPGEWPREFRATTEELPTAGPDGREPKLGSVKA